MDEKEDCENCKERHKQRLEWFIKIYNENSRYNNAVVSIGYASLLFIFSSVASNMPFVLKKIFGFFFIVSVGFFVISEIIKSFIQKDIDAVIYDYLTPQESLEAWFKEHDKKWSKAEKYWKYGFFPFSLISGILAALILLSWLFYPELFKILKIFLALFYI